MLPLENALVGAGDTRTILWICFIQNVINITMNYLLIFGRFGLPALGINGAAIGSLISLSCVTLILLLLFFKGRLNLSLSWQDFRWDSELAKGLIKIGALVSMECVAIHFGRLLYFKFIVAFGAAAMSSYWIGIHIIGLSFIINSGFSVTAATLVGQNLGAALKPEARKIAWTCTSMGTLAMAAVGLGLVSNSNLMIAFFAEEREVFRIGSAFICILAIACPFMAMEDTLAGALNGQATHSLRWYPLSSACIWSGFPGPGLQSISLNGELWLFSVCGYWIIWSGPSASSSCFKKAPG